MNGWFFEQSLQWDSIARRHAERVCKAASRYLELVITRIADEWASKALLLEVFWPAMKRILDQMRQRITELLNPHQHGHAITYNEDFMEAVYKLRLERYLREPKKVLKQFFRVAHLGQVHFEGD